jgi:8-oxo-dGTP diphosphatase
MAGISTVAIIIENQNREVLIQLRENKPNLPFANHWTLPGGNVELAETPLHAAKRESYEETGLELPLVLWKVYERSGRSDLQIEQHVFTGVTDRPIENIVLGEGVALRYITQKDIQSLQIAYGFDKLIMEFFSMRND